MQVSVKNGWQLSDEMMDKIQGEIEKYLSKKNIYFHNFSDELQTHLKSLYPDLPTIKSQWYMLKNGVSEIPKCELPNCNNSAKWNERNNQFDAGCCSDHNKRITSLKNFGTEHPNQSKKQQRKVKKSIREKYGVDYITQTALHKDSVRESVVEKYGVESVLQSPEVREKIKQTNLERYGVENPTENPEIRAKVQQTNLKRYGVKESLSSPEIRAKGNKTNLEKYGSIYPMRNEELLEKRRQYIIETYDAYSPNPQREADTEKYFHLNLRIEAENRGETYYYFFDDELETKQEQVAWVKNPKAERVVDVDAIDCIDNSARDVFIHKNSLYSQDSVVRQNFGLFAGNELVCIFSGYEKDEYFEITRFVTKIGIGFSQNIFVLILNHLKRNKPTIISFDRRFTPLNQPTLHDAGFEFIGGTEPKQNDVGFWDCGKLVYKAY